MDDRFQVKYTYTLLKLHSSIVKKHMLFYLVIENKIVPNYT